MPASRVPGVQCMKFVRSKATWCRLAAGSVFAIVLLLGLPQRGAAHTSFFRWHTDDDFLYVESDGMPAHKMMVGITAWQQQVPLPQDYSGDNAFRIPRHPVLADKPLNVKSALFSGAIAIAVNGIPIFNPIKNDGKTDTYIAGELDDFGGHCGRSDDYHYHLAPLFLVDTIGRENPIAYGMDGFPIYGLTEPDGSNPVGLDELNGHKDAKGNYHYHSTKGFPYLNGGLRGRVKLVKDAAVSQGLTTAVRPWLQALKGAKIVGFTWPSPNHYSLEYTIDNKSSFVNFSWDEKKNYTFEFVDPAGNKRTETYKGRPTRISAYVEADHGGNLIVKPGQSALYAWGSTSALKGETNVQIYKSTNNTAPENPVAADACGARSGPFKAIAGRMGSAHITAAACQAGYTYRYTFTASNATQGASDDLFVTVAN